MGDDEGLVRLLVDVLWETSALTTAELAIAVRARARGYSKLSRARLEAVLSAEGGPFFLVGGRHWYVDPDTLGVGPEGGAAARRDERETAESKAKPSDRPGPAIRQPSFSMATAGVGASSAREDLPEPALYKGPQLRPWQIEALQSWRANGERGIVEAVTGTGKSLVGIYAAAQALDQGQKVAIAVPSRVLLQQWTKALRASLHNVRIGQLGDGSTQGLSSCDVLVTTHKSASELDFAPPGSGILFIADEVHALGAPVLQQALASEYRSRLGLTATLEREGDEGVAETLLPYFEGRVFSYSYAEGLRDGVLAPFRVAFVGVRFTPDEQDVYEKLGRDMSSASRQLTALGHIREGDRESLATIARLGSDTHADYRAMKLARTFMACLSKRKALQAEATNKMSAIDAVAGPLSVAERGLVFTETVASATAVKRRLRAHMLTVDALHSRLSPDERRLLLARYRRGSLRILTAPRLLDEGLDVPDANVGVIVAASRSRRQMIQRMGRIVRPNSDGTPSTFYILYIEGTREDPRRGEYEGFLEEVAPHAVDTAYFAAEASATALLRWHRGL